jgi:hypothetical protein
MTARDTYNASIIAAAKTLTASKTANETTAQEAANQSGVNVGYTLQSGNNVNFVNGIKNAAIAKANANFAAEQAKQAALMVARDTLRTAGGDNAAF